MLKASSRQIISVILALMPTEQELQISQKKTRRLPISVTVFTLKLTTRRFTMKQLFLILSLSLFVTACAAPSGSNNRLPTDEEVELFNQTAAYDDQIVCSYEVVLGSVMRRRLCYSRIQIAERDERMAIFQDQARDDLDF